MKKEDYINHIIVFLLGWLYAFGIISGVVHITLLEGAALDILAKAFACCLIAFAITYNKRTLIITVLCLSGFALYLYRSFTGDVVAESLINKAEHLQAAWQFIIGLAEYSEAANITTINGLCAIAALVSIVLVKWKAAYPIAFALGAGVFIAANMQSAEGVFAPFFVMLAILIILFVKNSGNNNFNYIKIVPVCVAVILGAALLPMPQGRLSREMLENAYEEVYWFFREPFMPKYFSSSKTGFEDREGRLGGNLAWNNDFVMYVFADEPLYLSGITRDIYTGSGWVSSHNNEEFQMVEIADFSDDRYRGAVNFDEGLNAYYGDIKKVSINIGKARTGTLFKPDKAMNMTLYGDYGILQRGMDLRTEPVLKKDSIYNYEYVALDYNDEKIVNLLKKSERGFYVNEAEKLIDGIDYTVVDFLRFRFVDLYMNEMVPYADSVYENYTALPNSMPERVNQLAYTIISDYSGDYERVKAIQKYLQGMTYSLTPGNVPENRDFTDYFLFDNKEGYCTYYATAMAVLTRAIGLPSRYNEGYIMPAEKSPDGYYTVTSENAHAWAEVYFEGVGWVPFDATPNSFFEEHYPAYAKSSGSDYYDEEMEFLHDDDWRPYGNDDGEVDAPIVTGGEYKNNAQEELSLTQMFIVIVVLGAVSYIFIRKGAEERRHRIMNYGEPNTAAIEAFKGLVDLTAFCGMPMEKHESALAYAKRVGKYTLIGSAEFSVAAEFFSKARYGKEEITREESVAVSRAYFGMYRRIKASGDKYKFFVHRYVGGLGRGRQ